MTYNDWIKNLNGNSQHMKDFIKEEPRAIADINKNSKEIYEELIEGIANKDKAGSYNGETFYTLINTKEGKVKEPYALLHSYDGYYFAVSDTDLKKLLCKGTCNLNIK